MGHEWDFSVVLRPERLELLGMGLLGTLKLTAASLALAIPLGLFIAILRILRIRFVNWLVRLVTEVLRSTALLVFIFWFFFAFPLLFRVEITGFQAAILAIGVHSAAYFAELFRAGFESVPTGQWEAAKSLGLHFPQTLRLVVLPLAIRQMLPVMLNLSIEVLKSTSLATSVAFLDLTYAASQISSATYRPLETYTVVALLYFVVIATASRLTILLERKLALKGNW